MPLWRWHAPVFAGLVAIMAGCAGPAPQQDDESAMAAEAADSARASVDLFPDDSTYSLVHIDIGAIAISLDTIVATASGSEVRLQVGNTTGAGLEGLSASVAWGPLARGLEPQVEASRTRQVDLAAVAGAGKWTPVTIKLDGVLPADIKFLRLFDIDYTGLVLR